MPANCFGSSTGTVSASGNGGTGALTYLWPALGASTLATVNNVPAGTYSVTQTYEIKNPSISPSLRRRSITKPMVSLKRIGL